MTTVEQDAVEDRLSPVGWAWHPLDWQMAAADSVQDARVVTRAQAHARFSHGEYHWVEVGVWKRFARRLDRQERWEYWVENQDGGWDEHPDGVPDDWDGAPWDEDVPVWTFCHRHHPDVIPVWVCGLRLDGPPPPSPRPPSSREAAA